MSAYENLPERQQLAESVSRRPPRTSQLPHNTLCYGVIFKA